MNGPWRFHTARLGGTCTSNHIPPGIRGRGPGIAHAAASLPRFGRLLSAHIGLRSQLIPAVQTITNDEGRKRWQ